MSTATQAPGGDTRASVDVVDPLARPAPMGTVMGGAPGAAVDTAAELRVELARSEVATAALADQLQQLQQQVAALTDQLRASEARAATAAALVDGRAGSRDALDGSASPGSRVHVAGAGGTAHVGTGVHDDASLGVIHVEHESDEEDVSSDTSDDDYDAASAEHGGSDDDDDDDDDDDSGSASASGFGVSRRASERRASRRTSSHKTDASTRRHSRRPSYTVPVKPSEVLKRVRDGDLPVLIHLLRRGAGVTFADPDDGMTPLHMAAVTARPDISAPLLDRLPDSSEAVVARDATGAMPLHLAALVDAHNVATQLLERAPVRRSIDAVDARGCTALHWAARHGSTRVAELLLNRSANARAADAFARYTPLHLAAAANAADVVELLVDRDGGAEAVRDSSINGSTPLHVAAAFDARDAALVLLSHGADARAVEERGSTPLHVAMLMNAQRTAAVLLKKGANPCDQDSAGRTALHMAAAVASPPMRAFQDQINVKPAALHVVDIQGNTPLHHAALWGGVDRVAALLLLGAEPSRLNAARQTASALALEVGDQDAAALVLDVAARGVDVVLHDTGEATSQMLRAGGGHSAWGDGVSVDHARRESFGGGILSPRSLVSPGGSGADSGGETPRDVLAPTVVSPTSAPSDLAADVLSRGGSFDMSGELKSTVFGWHGGAGDDVDDDGDDATRDRGPDVGASMAKTSDSGEVDGSLRDDRVTIGTGANGAGNAAKTTAVGPTPDNASDGADDGDAESGSDDPFAASTDDEDESDGAAGGERPLALAVVPRDHESSSDARAGEPVVTSPLAAVSTSLAHAIANAWSDDDAQGEARSDPAVGGTDGAAGVGDDTAEPQATSAGATVDGDTASSAARTSSRTRAEAASGGTESDDSDPFAAGSSSSDDDKAGDSAASAGATSAAAATGVVEPEPGGVSPLPPAALAPTAVSDVPGVSVAPALPALPEAGGDDNGSSSDDTDPFAATDSDGDASLP